MFQHLDYFCQFLSGTHKSRHCHDKCCILFMANSTHMFMGRSSVEYFLVWFCNLRQAAHPQYLFLTGFALCLKFWYRFNSLMLIAWQDVKLRISPTMGNIRSVTCLVMRQWVRSYLCLIVCWLWGTFCLPMLVCCSCCCIVVHLVACVLFGLELFCYGLVCLSFVFHQFISDLSEGFSS